MFFFFVLFSEFRWSHPPSRPGGGWEGSVSAPASPECVGMKHAVGRMDCLDARRDAGSRSHSAPSCSRFTFTFVFFSKVIFSSLTHNQIPHPSRPRPFYFIFLLPLAPCPPSSLLVDPRSTARRDGRVSGGWWVRVVRRAHREPCIQSHVFIAVRDEHVQPPDKARADAEVAGGQVPGVRRALRSHRTEGPLRRAGRVRVVRRHWTVLIGKRVQWSV